MRRRSSSDDYCDGFAGARSSGAHGHARGRGGHARAAAHHVDQRRLRPGRIPTTLADWVTGLDGEGSTQTPHRPPAAGALAHAHALLERLNGVGAWPAASPAEPTRTLLRPPPNTADASSVTIAPDRFATRPSWRPADFAAGDLAPSTRLLLHLVEGRWVAEHPGPGVQVTFHDGGRARSTDCARLSSGELDDFHAAVLAALIDNALVVPQPLRPSMIRATSGSSTTTSSTCAAVPVATSAVRAALPIPGPSRTAAGDQATHVE